jgi:hypothetical protein
MRVNVHLHLFGFPFLVLNLGYFLLFTDKPNILYVTPMKMSQTAFSIYP